MQNWDYFLNFIKNTKFRHIFKKFLMKVVLLAGGFGSRLAEETAVKPKPLVEIGGIPIIEHIMNWYMSFGYNEFIICLGYKGSYRILKSII